MHSASSVRRFLTEGQVFRSHYDTFTALNQVYGHRPLGVRACPDFRVDSQCMDLGVRIWDDGLVALRLDDGVAIVERWLQKTCDVGEPTSVDQLGAYGSGLIPFFVSAFEVGPTAAGRRDVEESARLRFARGKEVLSQGRSGLSSVDATAARGITEAAYVAEALSEHTFRYRSNALRGLGSIGGAGALNVLRAVADNNQSPFQTVAQGLLQQPRF